MKGGREELDKGKKGQDSLVIKFPPSLLDDFLPPGFLQV